MAVTPQGTSFLIKISTSEEGEGEVKSWIFVMRDKLQAQQNTVIWLSRYLLEGLRRLGEGEKNRIFFFSLSLF